MKTILVICKQSDIDAPLRRSLAHLVKSCEVTVVADGFQVFNELKTKTFDLIITDSEITGIDSLELVESIDYIDPGIPVILMLRQEQKALWGAARRLKANPILRPFKPITFLRLIDTLLHEHLERYRELAETLKSILENLSGPTQAPLAFLVDNSGQPLISTGEAEPTLLQTLGNLVISKITVSQLPQNFVEVQDAALLAPTPLDKDHELYVTTVIDNLYLGLVFPVAASYLTPTDIWQWLDATAKEVKIAFYHNASLEGIRDEGSTGSLNSSREHLLIPLHLGVSGCPNHVPVPPQPLETEDYAAINWQIIPETTTLLNRLQDFCQVN